MWTLDITILQVSGGMFRTVASQTLFNMGGRLFDEAIADLFASEFKRSVMCLYIHRHFRITVDSGKWI